MKFRTYSKAFFYSQQSFNINIQHLIYQIMTCTKTFFFKIIIYIEMVCAFALCFKKSYRKYSKEVNKNIQEVVKLFRRLKLNR